MYKKSFLFQSISIFMIALFVTVIPTVYRTEPAYAAKKKSSKKQAPSGDAVVQILRKYKPENKTNAQIIRNVLKKYKQNHIFIITLTDDYDVIVECVSAKNGASGGKVSMTLYEADYYTNNPNAPGLGEMMQNACIFEYSGLALRFYKAKIKSETDFEHVNIEYLFGAEALDRLFDRNGLFVEDKFPFILNYLEMEI